MTLTPGQKKELHEAVYAFLVNKGYAGAAEAFALQADLPKEFVDKDMSQLGDLLERKWTSVIRLSRQRYDLQRKINQLKEEIDQLSRAKKMSGGADISSMNEGLPSYPEKHILKGHMKPVNQVIFHPLFSLLLSGSDDGSIKIWDYETGVLQNTLRGHTNHVTDLSFDRQGKLLASSSKDLKIRLWNSEKWDCTKILTGHDHMVNSVRFVPPNSDFIVSSSSDKTIRIWEISTGYCKRIFKGIHDQAISKVVPNQTGEIIASCGRDQVVALWSLKSTSMQADSGSQSPVLHIMKEHEHAIQTLAFANSLARVTIVQSEYYDGPGREEIKQEQPADSSGGQTTGTEGGTSNVSQEEKKLLSPEELKDRKLAQIKKQIEEKKREKRSQKEAAAAAAASNTTVQTRHLPEFLASGARDCNIILWEVGSGRAIKTFEGHDNWVTEVFFHSNGKYLMSSSDDHTVRIWDLKRGRCFKRFEAHSHFVTTIAMSKQGYPTLATGCVDNTIKIWPCR